MFINDLFAWRGMCRRLAYISLCVTLVTAVLGVNRALAEEPLQVTLHPPEIFHQTLEQTQATLPFHQTIPLPKGVFHMEKGHYGLNIAGMSTAASIKPARLWPDGSVRMLRVHALWPPEQRAEGVIPATVHHLTSQQDVEASAVEVVDERTIRFGLTGQDEWQMQVHASVAPLLQEKQIERTTDPDYWDTKGQYHWAQPIADVSDVRELIELSPVIREHTILEQTPLYREHLIEGVGGVDSPGSDLEWQLRIVEYSHAPLFEVTMTWKIFWDPETYALAEATTRFVSPEQVAQVAVPGIEAEHAINDSELLMYAHPEARVDVWHEDQLLHEADGRDSHVDALTMRVGDTWLGLALPRMGRLGPNHLRVAGREIEIASWSHREQAVLDLRHSTEPGEFGLADMDFRDGAAGLAFSRRFTFTFDHNQHKAQAMAKMHADYGQYWFASRADYLASQAIGPWREHAAERYATYLQGLHANLHFLIRSRHHWRWTGLINYGDMRTNFAIGERHERGLYPRRWASHGRYGWRNGSGQPYLGLLKAGLYLEDREMMLAALDYAFHVADVDMRQPRRFNNHLPRTGGFHRRNKDHWSGSIQVQYTPSSGIYLAHWLTGEQRLAQATEAIRDFMGQESGGSGSLFAASAWIQHYQETHDTQALERAERLFEQAVQAWEQRQTDPRISGPQALYYDNFRRKLDGYQVLIEFFNATGDRQYLDHMLASIHAHEPPSSFTLTLAAHIGPAYLLANGYTVEEIGQERIDILLKELTHVIPTNLPDYAVGDYDSLMTLTTEYLPPTGSSSYRESAAIGWRARNALAVLSWFHTEAAKAASNKTDE